MQTLGDPSPQSGDSNSDYNLWAQDFQFSEELQELEKAVAFHLASNTVARTELDKQAADKGGEPSATLLASDDSVVRDFSRLIAGAVLERFADEAFMEKCLRLHDLKKENEVLSSQVSDLMLERKRLEMEVARTESQCTQYKRLFGNLYLKFDS
jgi:hypothetical protein